MSSRDDEIAEKYRKLQEEAQVVFAGLRDLPAFGQQWKGYYSKTFQVYTTLWKLQQEHRGVLERENGLKRWQIGDMASRVGQLYYHYYLRTSDSSYLFESSIFYEAIQERQYFRDVPINGSSESMMRMLRYYARFIVVSLMLQRLESVEKAKSHLERLIGQYVKQFSPPDAQEWQFVLQEISEFINSASISRKTSMGEVSRSLRVSPVPQETFGNNHSLHIKQCLLVGSQTNQIKFSELTLDMFRIMQVVESGNEKRRSNKGRNASEKTQNPLKHLLYRPTLFSLMVYLYQALNELRNKEALFLYISADPSCNDEGVVLNVPRRSRSWDQKQLNDETEKIHTFTNCDLLSATRKPLFLICECKSAFSFASLKSNFDVPYVMLLSPQQYVDELDRSKQVFSPYLQGEEARISHQHGVGNLFTLFLSDPIAALLALCSLNQPTSSQVRMCSGVLKDSRQGAIALLKTVPSWNAFVGDEISVLFMFKYMFCCHVLKAHKRVPDNQEYHPSSNPSLSEDISSCKAIKDAVSKISQILNVSDQFV